MKLQGTSVVKFSNFLENLKDIAGTCLSITRAQYDDNENKICSFSHAGKIFGLTWNQLLEKTGISPTKIFTQSSNQGRKLKNKSKYKEIGCLRCDSLFVSSDPCNFRICAKCKNMIELEE